MSDDSDDRLYLDLKGARERLCRAQTFVDPTDSATLQGALDRIDLVACDLPQWSRFDGGRACPDGQRQGRDDEAAGLSFRQRGKK